MNTFPCHDQMRGKLRPSGRGGCQRIRQHRRAAIVAILSLLFFSAACFLLPEKESETIRIGILLPLTGSSDLGWREPLEWAVSKIENAGGVANRRLELVYADTEPDLLAAARKLAEDPTIAAVIGPDRSASVFEVAPLFIKAEKPLVSPSATSGDIFRAFAHTPYVWRTVESDIAQVQTMLLIASRSGARRVALLSSYDAYGTTFFNWFGFFATELDMEITSVLRYDQNVETCDLHVDQALSGEPELLFAVPSNTRTAICMVEAVKRHSTETRLFFTDGGYFPDLINDLGANAEGLEGTTPAPDPGSGFEISYRVNFGQQPPPFAANIYDALLLLAYGLERSGGKGGEELGAAMVEVVQGRGEAVRWDADGIRKALELIRSGSFPNLSGATGPFEFDREQQTELVASTYAHWRVEYGEFVLVERLNTGKDRRGSSVAQTFASSRFLQELDTDEPISDNLPQREGLWALVAATSTGWNNYRHQADALAKYQLLKESGLSDDRIVLIMADDIAFHSSNNEPGVVRNVAGGPNLYNDAIIDYTLDEHFDAFDLLDILAGHRSERLPVVLESGPGDDIYVFLIGHGARHGLQIDSTSAQPQIGDSKSFLKPSDLNQSVSWMHRQERFRRMLIVVEACNSGILAEDLIVPRTLLLSAANPFQSSFGANYDPLLGAWLSNEFSYLLYETATFTPDISLYDLYRTLYLGVRGSHVSVYNNRLFGNLHETTIDEFLSP